MMYCHRPHTIVYPNSITEQSHRHSTVCYRFNVTPHNDFTDTSRRTHAPTPTQSQPIFVRIHPTTVRANGMAPPSIDTIANNESVYADADTVRINRRHAPAAATADRVGKTTNVERPSTEADVVADIVLEESAVDAAAADAVGSDEPTSGSEPQEQWGLPKKQGLYDPENEHDACGVGFIVAIDGKRSHKVRSSCIHIRCDRRA